MNPGQTIFLLCILQLCKPIISFIINNLIVYVIIYGIVFGIIVCKLLIPVLIVQKILILDCKILKISYVFLLVFYIYYIINNKLTIKINYI